MSLDQIREAVEDRPYPNWRHLEALHSVWTALADCGRRDAWVADRLAVVEDRLLIDALALRRMGEAEIQEIGDFVTKIAPGDRFDWSADLLRVLRHEGHIQGVAAGSSEIQPGGQRVAVLRHFLTAPDVPLAAELLLALDWFAICRSHGLQQAVCAVLKTDPRSSGHFPRLLGFLPCGENETHIYLRRPLLPLGAEGATTGAASESEGRS